MTRNLITTSVSPLRRAAARMAMALLATLAFLPPAEAALEFASNHPTLQAAIAAAGSGGTLIVDQNYPNLVGPIVLPTRFRLVGLGIQSDAVLTFPTKLAGSAIIFAPAPPNAGNWVEIEHIDIEGPFVHEKEIVTTAKGIDLTNASNVFIRNVTVRGFDVGILGFNSQSIHVENSTVAVNRTDHYRLTGDSTSWRISGGTARFAERFGIAVFNGNDISIEGVVLESNSNAGVFTNTLGTHITRNRFECHVHPEHHRCKPTTVAVRIGPAATETTLVDNFYSGVGIEVVDQSVQHSTYRFDNANPVQMSPPPGVSPLQVRFAGKPGPDFLIDGQGQVRIGSDSQPPEARLVVNAQPDEAPLRVRTGNAIHLAVRPDGRVGIGTLLPDTRLHVEGNLKLNGNLVSDGEICIGSGC